MNKKDVVKAILPYFITIIAIAIGISVYVYNNKQEVKQKIQYYEDKISDSTLSAYCTCPSNSIPVKSIGTLKYSFSFDAEGTCTLDFKFTPNKNTSADAKSLTLENLQWTVKEDGGEYFIEIEGINFDEWSKGELDPILVISDHDSVFAVGTRESHDVFFEIAEDENGKSL